MSATSRDDPTQPDAPTVLIADDHGAIRAGLRIMLEGHGIEVVGEAADGEVAVRNARALRPDVVMMDLRMPGRDGISATRQIVAEALSDVLVLTSFDEDDLVHGAIAAGAVGFLLKTADAATLVGAVRSVAAGDGVLDPRVTRRALAAARETAQQSSVQRGRLSPDLDQLTARERDVLDGILHGWSNAQLADRLGISVPTVKTHVSNVLMKLGAHSRSHAAALVRRSGA